VRARDGSDSIGRRRDVRAAESYDVWRAGSIVTETDVDARFVELLGRGQVERLGLEAAVYAQTHPDPIIELVVECARFAPPLAPTLALVVAWLDASDVVPRLAAAGRSGDADPTSALVLLTQLAHNAGALVQDSWSRLSPELAA
jgi:hypothetical protein